MYCSLQDILTKQHSVANKLIIRGIKERIPSLKEDYLAQLYPDYRIDVKAEQEKLLWADTIIIQVPLFWFAIPSIVMRWIEEVLCMAGLMVANGKAPARKEHFSGYHSWFAYQCIRRRY